MIIVCLKNGFSHEKAQFMYGTERKKTSVNVIVNVTLAWIQLTFCRCNRFLVKICANRCWANGFFCPFFSYRFSVDNWQRCAFSLFFVENHVTKTFDTLSERENIAIEFMLKRAQKIWNEEFHERKKPRSMLKKAIVCTWNRDICVHLCQTMKEGRD